MVANYVKWSSATDIGTSVLAASAPIQAGESFNAWCHTAITCQSCLPDLAESICLHVRNRAIGVLP